MKKNQNFFSLKSTTLILVFLFLSNALFAQTDSAQVVQTDPKPVEVQQVKEKNQKKDRKRKDEFKAFALGVGGNDLGISMDDLNTFNFYGQGGIGVDVAFLFLETGFSYGFSDLFKNDIQSNPYQVYVNLGFRF